MLSVRGSTPRRIPSLAYKTAEGLPLKVYQELYSRIGETTSRELVESFILPIRSGRAWTVSEGYICWLTTPDGQQVGDLNIWNLIIRESAFGLRARGSFIAPMSLCTTDCGHVSRI